MLHDIQRQFLDDLFNQTDSPAILSAINSNGSRTAYDQFMSYRHSVIGGIIEALAISYPVIKKLTGEQFFNHITAQFIQQTPSLSPDLNNYGFHYSEFIDSLDNLDSLPYLSDIAKLEWAWQKIINGSNRTNSNLHLLADIDEKQNDKISFQLSPHSSLLQSKFAIHRIWEANQENVTINENINFDFAINLIIFRYSMDMNITVLTEKQFYFLSLINQPLIFSDVCMQYNAAYPEDDIDKILALCIQSHWIDSFSL